MNPIMAMHDLYRVILWATTIMAATLALRFGFIAATESDHPQKGRARLFAVLTIGIWLCVAPVLVLLMNATLQTFQFEGVVSCVCVIHSGSMHYQASIVVQTTLGGSVTANTNNSFHGLVQGDRVRIRYQADTGELLQAAVLAPDGSVMHSFQRSRGAVWGMIALGLFFVWGSIRRYRRDPEGQIECTDSLPTSLLADDGAAPSPEEITAWKQEIGTRLRTAKKRALAAIAASVLGCASVSLFLSGGMLHRWWDSVGTVVLWITYVLLMAALYFGIMWWAAWNTFRKIDKDCSESSSH
ncbi:MAG: hypothetical protein P4L03_03490 [Terracidiphilus sp.]|nr:hypothetical protein [Terracidiphilus sp.]